MNRRLFATLAQRQAALALMNERCGGSASGRSGIASLSPEGPSRRQFLQRGLAAGMVTGLPLMAACGGSDDAPDTPPGKVKQTVFFNLSHVDHKGRPYTLEAGGKTYALTPVAEKPGVLAAARTNNKFLAAVPDEHVTHHVEDLLHDTQNVSFGYVVGVVDPSQPAAKTWTMTAIYVFLPATAAVSAYAHASRQAKSPTLKLSHKRRKYGMAAAASAQDLADEGALMDATDHAAALISFNPNIMALDANAAHTVKSSYIAHAQATQDCHDAIVAYGDAKPEGVDPDNPGWATLKPIIRVDGQVATITKGPDAGRIQYAPIYHPDVATAVGNSNRELWAGVGGVRNDPSFGIDASGNPAAAAAQGKLWTRHDGRLREATIVPGAVTDSTIVMTQVDESPNKGLDCEVDTTDNGATIQIDVSYTNWWLRNLSTWVEFYDEAGKLIDITTLPGFADKSMFVGGGLVHYDPQNPNLRGGAFPVAFQTSPATIMGVPVTLGEMNGGTAFTINMPKSVHSVTLLSAGLGLGSVGRPELIGGAVALTVINCMVMPMMFGALGAIQELQGWKSKLQDLLELLGSTLVTAIEDIIDTGEISSAQDWVNVMFTTIANLTSFLAGAIVKKGFEKIMPTILEALAAALVLDIAEKAIPVVNGIMSAISVIAALFDVALTSYDCAISPFIYTTRLVFTHKLAITLLPDLRSSTFPDQATLVILTALFDDGQPMTTTMAWSGSAQPSLTMAIENVPLGGLVNIHVAFEQKATGPGGTQSILLGTGATGLIPNDDTAKTLRITQIAFPIGPTTVFQHKHRTMLDAGGKHVWVEGTVAPSTNLGNLNSGSPGQLSAFRSLTVRQGSSGTTPRPKRLGYSWTGRNLPGGPASCVSGDQGELDQVAVLNADFPDLDYAVTTCGSNYGDERVVFDLEGSGQNNFYLDTTSGTGIIRQIRLEPPNAGIDGGASNLAWGVLNLTSDALMLFPQGFIISLCASQHMFEVIKLGQPMSDADAMVKLLAQRHSGEGDRPGLISAPVSAAVTSKGALLILEGGNNRVQAFDMNGNPVQYFQNAPTPYFIQLDDTQPGDGWVHLDIKVDFADLLYVLSYNSVSYEYRLNIYVRDQKDFKPISTTKNIYADKIAVSLFRDLFTLNYEVIQNRDTPTARPLVTEPSVSLWTPCNLNQTCPVG